MAKIILILIAQGAVSLTGYAQRKPPSVAVMEYCSAVDAADNLKPRRVQLKALMAYSTIGRVDGDDPILFSARCNNRDYFAEVDMSRLKLRRSHRSFFAALPGESKRVIEVELVGDLSTSFTPAFGHLQWSRTSILVEQIVHLADVTGKPAVPRPDWQTAAPRTELGERLQAMNSNLLQHFFLIAVEASSDLADDFTGVDPLGRSFDRSNYRDMLRPHLFRDGLFKSIESSNPSVTIEGAQLLARGWIRITSKTGEQLSFNYENTYRERNGTLMLSKFRLLKR